MSSHFQVENWLNFVTDELIPWFIDESSSFAAGGSIFDSISLELRSFPLLFKSTPSAFRFSCWFGQPIRVLVGSAPVDGSWWRPGVEWRKHRLSWRGWCMGKTGGLQTRILECSVFSNHGKNIWWEGIPAWKSWAIRWGVYDPGLHRNQPDDPYRKWWRYLMSQWCPEGYSHVSVHEEVDSNHSSIILHPIEYQRVPGLFQGSWDHRRPGVWLTIRWWFWWREWLVPQKIETTVGRTVGRCSQLWVDWPDGIEESAPQMSLEPIWDRSAGISDAPCGWLPDHRPAKAGGHAGSKIVVVVVVEITLLTSILSGVTWTVAYSEF